MPAKNKPGQNKHLVHSLRSFLRGLLPQLLELSSPLQAHSPPHLSKTKATPGQMSLGTRALGIARSLSM